MRAVVLLSGGLDSTVCMAVAKHRGYEVFPLSFHYQQRHCIELENARKVANFFGVSRHLVIETNMGEFGGSALTDPDIAVPLGDITRRDIPSTYVPARNLIFLSYALGYAEALQAEKIFIGVNALDYSGYPDCRPEFISLFQQLADYSTKAAVQDKQRISIETPLIQLSKKDIILLGAELKAPFELTHSCYRGGVKACGTCDSCLLRLKGFAEAGFADPVPYEASNDL
ncbi:7-cyano-7-deazaguanine synthase QueC|uniref:7-cyano-7-deazaguanine synthase n=1 Tax=Dendrosporobacter quercicolus TaxID=146817 RepID=A0A1G9LG38_9FIRM|nr:7-cyano-7-deazaguanine synthase QueC [Dendrosporobacter quercicolus]NSL46701.1 7-cyano-7-deazaguanine synthase QueC [Dendrosporobacter quercicolus DSM 1736]SDL60891.1 7-cyano-7-deazaguanine synthase [Dendrosporobacter quercicolus]